MTAFQIHNTEDFITLESANQAISIIGFSLTKSEDGVLTELSRRILTFIDSFGYSSVIQMTETSLRLHVIISASNVGEVINKASVLLNKMEKIDPVSPYLIISPINHKGMAEDLRKNYTAPIRKTSEPRIVKLDNKYWILASLIFDDQGHPSITRYFQDLLTFSDCGLYLSTRVINKSKNGKKSYHKGILISYYSSSFEKSIEYLNHLQIISLQYKEKFSLTIRFHSLNEIKRNKVLYLLGLPNKSQIATTWNNFYKIEKFIPNIRDRTKREEKRDVFTSENEIIIEKRSKSIIASFLQLLKIPILLRKLTGNTQTSKPPLETTLGAAHQIDENHKKDSKVYLPFTPYGKEVSDEEIEELVKKIPQPPVS